MVPYDLTTFPGQIFFVGILVQTMTSKGNFEINWPLIFTSNFKDWWVMMKKTQAQWIPCLYQWWKIMGTLAHKPTKIMWTKEVILRHRHIWNQENLVRILNVTQTFADSLKIIFNLELSFPSYMCWCLKINSLEVMWMKFVIFQNCVTTTCILIFLHSSNKILPIKYIFAWFKIVYLDLVFSSRLKFL